MSIKIVQRYRFLPRNAGEGEVDFMLVCQKITNQLITLVNTLFLSVKICVSYSEFSESSEVSEFSEFSGVIACDG